jgi:glycerate kinase
MAIVLAPDSFKGSLSAAQFCDLAVKAAEKILPGEKMYSFPMADGGEGTVEAMVYATGGTRIAHKVTGPLGKKIEAFYGMLPDNTTAVIEMAAASGLPLVPGNKRNPAVTTSFGTGELIKHAVGNGAKKIILGLGGSATNDGGVGALQALGCRFLDKAGREISQGGGNLINLCHVDSSRLVTDFEQVEIILASDVINPLLGENGATRIFGPQKGGNDVLLEQLENSMGQFAAVTAAVTGKDYSMMEGAGAAGGMGFGFLAYTGAVLQSGFDIIADCYDLPKILAGGDVDLLITGEGEINGQSVQGKLIGRIAAMAFAKKVPVIALAGKIGKNAEALYGIGVSSMMPIITGPMTLAEAMEDAAGLVEQRLTDCMTLYKAIRR